MDLAISEPRLSKGGKLSGVIQIWDVLDLIWGRKVEDFASEVDSLAAELTERGIPDSVATLSARIEQAIEALDDSRQRGGRFAPHQWLNSAIWYIEKLKSSGRFLRVGTGAYYMPSGGTHPVNLRDRAEVEILLGGRFGELNPTLQHTRFVIAELVTFAAIRGDVAQLFDTTTYDRANARLHIDQADGGVLCIDATGIKRIENGADGKIFRSHPSLTPWKYVSNHGFPLRVLLQDLALRDGGVAGMSAHAQRLSLLAWWTFLLFSSDYEERPITLFQGPIGSGKTTAARLIGRIIFGPKFQVNSNFDSNEAQKAFWTSVTNRLYVVLDNFEHQQKWTEDALAAVATGSEISKPVLYETNTEGLFPVRATIAVTAIAPKFRRPDVASRLWFFWFGSLGERRESEWWADWIRHHRDAALSELATYASWWLAAPHPETSTSSLRMAGFALWAMRFGESLDLAEAQGDIGPWDGDDRLPSHRQMIDSIIEAQEHAQRRFAAEKFPVLEVLEIWATGTDGDEVPNPSRWVTSSELVDELNAIAVDRGLGRVLANSIAWSWFLRRNQGVVESTFDVKSSRRGRRGRCWQIAPIIDPLTLS